MFLLIRVMYVWCYIMDVIYIPLCFYLYLVSGLITNAPQLNLHSTMFLLIPDWFLPTKSTERIYIPLCFYLYALWADLRRRLLHLHSTMFLLIRVWLYSLSAYPSFTFHYVSTYTVVAGKWIKDKVGIYIPLCFYLYFHGYSDDTFGE